MTRVAVIGAGVTGLSVAWHLAERGLGPVTIHERSGIGAGASGIQPGGVRQQWATRENCLLARESAAFYAGLGERLETRAQARLDRCGYLFVARSGDELDRLRANVGVQHEVGVPSRIVSPEEAAELVPGLRTASVAGAAWCGEDGYVDRPQAVVEAFAEAALRRGVRLEHAQVRSIERDGDAWRVDDRGFEHVVVAAGTDTADLLEPLGVRLPIEPERRYLFYGEPLRERLLEPLVVSTELRFAAKQLANGRLLASDLGGRSRDVVRRGVEELLPRLEYVPLALVVSGDYDVTPDRQAIVGGFAGRPGLWVAAGFSGHGFMLAPAVGRRVAALVAGEPSGPELAPFAPDRFERAAPLVPESQVI
jgi:glycine/D-amino acid oxidase-like deaminating enzyme